METIGFTEILIKSEKKLSLCMRYSAKSSQYDAEIFMKYISRVYINNTGSRQTCTYNKSFTLISLIFLSSSITDFS